MKGGALKSESLSFLRHSRPRPTSSDRIIRLEFGYVARVDIRVVVPIASVFDEEEIDRVNKHFDRAFSAEDERFRSVNHTGELEKKKKKKHKEIFSSFCGCFYLFVYEFSVEW